MSKQLIVFQGEPGANSHLAISEAYPKAEAVPCATFEDCFAAASWRRRTGGEFVANRLFWYQHDLPTNAVLQYSKMRSRRFGQSHLAADDRTQ